jgi:Rrf2 family protein
MTHLATLEGQGPVIVRRVAESEHIPPQFLSKILHGLRNKGLVKSTKGPGGGYELARPAKEIHVTDVIEAIDGANDFGRVCVLGLDQCSDENPCAMHDPWTRFRDQLDATVSRLTLADLARTLKRKRVTTVT